MKTIIILVLIALILFLIAYYEFHTMHFGVCSMINGGVKAGKTCLVVNKALRAQRTALFKLYLIAPLRYIKQYINQKREIKKGTWSQAKELAYERQWELPLIYSNIPVKSKYYVPLTTEIIKREKRMNYKSSCILSEVSLIANSMNYKDDLLNEQIELFIKLYGHATRGGTLWIDTQALGDNHYSIKRSIDTTCWIERTIKIPFFIIYRVRKLMVCDENTMNTNQGNPDENCKTILVPKSTWKKYDRYCYSIFTDDKERVAKYIDTRKLKDLKAKKVPTFRKFKTLNFKEEENEK